MTRAATFFPAKLTVPASMAFHVEMNLISAASIVADAASAAATTARFIVRSRRKPPGGDPLLDGPADAL